ncbi:MAG: sigma-54-dependent Fis family transcriptional regulator [candidate division Zixibacteria bacterium]|nr:sigma-54-dependent Fis family transcriptional regulator [candidate division Zixibacteria bacterium]
MPSILIVDDDRNLCNALKPLLTRNGHTVECAFTAASAQEWLEKRLFDLVVTDLRLSDGLGIDIIRTAKRVLPDAEVIMLTGFGSVDTAVEAMRCGAFDYMTKPFNEAEMLLTVEKALAQKKMKSELKHLKLAFAENYNFDSIIGSSPAIKSVIDVIKQVAPQEINILITGDSGTGKELIAKAIHNNSQRRDGKFVAINCSAMPELLLESELFGHVKGAFTSATANKKGLFEEASGGTIFLDEVGDTSPSLQAKLLRVLQEEEIRPVGSNETFKTNVRVIAATNKNLEQMVARGRFREDLYYRLNVISLHLPSLAERREDIVPLAQHFLARYCDHFNKPPKRLSVGACDKLMAHEWPGNVRELENTIKRAVALSIADVIDVDNLFLMKPMPKRDERGDRTTGGAETASLEDMQKEHIVRSLRENRWNYSITAGKLGIGRTTLWRKVKKFNIVKE